MNAKIPNIVIFASGSGSNAENIINWSKERNCYRVTAVFCNRKDAFVHTRAERLGVPHFTFSPAGFRDNSIIYNGVQRTLTDVLSELETDYIILAGFLLKVPGYLLESYPERILNIHPALLPSYGGKGMYGEYVHKAVIAAGEKESGITIHLVDNQYDHGRILYQAKCPVSPEDTPETLFEKVHQLERAYPEVIEKYIRG
ncbi:MAG TPA: phosphoribosylglycinamide formyltransferase [Candidatus Coprenecus stercoravium]|uniref:Phosphoribosylglycinamide formyltransferase n=1 Tax=Candidatus Coprenecus stercoravium TaxID=2840735 RepID=A0A9D2GR35_9BACT|nr:phosphoribosylglycinamide formyltransferase [Candidatus Coprenecus stercoravium]